MQSEPPNASRRRASVLTDIADQVPATVAKNEFGRVLDLALRSGRVVITKHDLPRAVLLSAEAYEALAGRTAPDLDALSAEFDALLEVMQAPKSRAATAALFNASSAALGKAAVSQIRRRKSARKRG